MAYQRADGVSRATTDVTGILATGQVGLSRDRVFELMTAAQARITARFEAVEPAAAFRSHVWRRPEGGGGTAQVLAGGAVFAKVAVNVSAVHGEAVPASLAKQHPDTAGRPFFATGLSLIAHAVNPYVPSFHANFRYFEVADGGVWWFGGGADLTPCYGFEADARYFHGVLKQLCDSYSNELYSALKGRCDAYFYLPHRDEMRGIGGIFFDQLTPPVTGGKDAIPGGAGWQRDFSFVAAGLACIPETYLPIVERRRHTPYGARELSWQSHRRGRYVEFNLLYDRGTLFGLQSNGNIEAILASLPPQAAWTFDHRPEPDTPEARLTSFLRPRDWLDTRSVDGPD